MYGAVIKWIGVFSFVGAVLPFLFTAAWSILDRYSAINAWLGGKLELLQLLVWPSSIFMMATAATPGVDWTMLMLAVVVNVVLYAAIGGVVWWGIYRQRWVLFPLGALVLLGWYRLLNL